MNLKNSNQTGFTLIELMLVLVVITVMMISAFRTMQEKASAMQVQRVGEQIEDIMSGAQQFYLEYGAWPGSSQATATSDATTDMVSQGLISPLVNSPWDTPYSLCPIELDADTSTTAAVCVASSESKPIASNQAGFFVYLKVPSMAAAYQVAALVPNGVVFPVDGGFQVQSYVVSGTMSNANFIQFATQVEATCHGVTPATPQIPVPNCPTNWTPQIYAVPAGFSSMPYKSSNSGSWSVYNFQKLAAFYAIVKPVTSTSNSLIGWNIYAQSYQEDGVNYPCGAQALIAVFTRCVPSSQAGGNTGVTNNSVDWQVGNTQ